MYFLFILSVLIFLEEVFLIFGTGSSYTYSFAHFLVECTVKNRLPCAATQGSINKKFNKKKGDKDEQYYFITEF